MELVEDKQTSYTFASLTQDYNAKSNRWTLLPICKKNLNDTSLKEYLPSNPPSKVQFTLVKGVDLPICDMNGTSDPYVKLQWESQKTSFWKSIVIEKNLNPEWEKKGKEKGKTELFQVTLDLSNRSIG
jgi:Ca2+-dependent lipid-binding protein